MPSYPHPETLTELSTADLREVFALSEGAVGE